MAESKASEARLFDPLPRKGRFKRALLDLKSAGCFKRCEAEEGDDYEYSPSYGRFWCWCPKNDWSDFSHWANEIKELSVFGVYVVFAGDPDPSRVCYVGKSGTLVQGSGATNLGDRLQGYHNEKPMKDFLDDCLSHFPDYTYLSFLVADVVQSADPLPPAFVEAFLLRAYWEDSNRQSLPPENRSY